MNPVIKFMVKQLEDNAVMIEKVTKANVEGLNYDKTYHLNHAFDSLHTAITAIKHIVGEVL